VIDDLDVYPPQPDDEVLGTTEFTWLVKAPGQPTHVLVPGRAATAFAVDPASYTPGDLLEVRVEIYDRMPEAMNCGTDPTAR